MKEKRNKKIIKNVKGITLIALVVTIIVLLILAGISINIAFNTGIISKSKNATAKYQEATANETNSLNYIEGWMDAQSTSTPETPTSTSATATTVAGAIAEGKEGKYYDKNTTITDSSETLATVKVPAGFKIASDSATTVAGGVVIEDVSANDKNSKGNQFVWIPCTLDGASGSVQLGRYTFSTTDGTSTLVQAGSDYAKDPADTYYQELQTSTYGNTTAKSLENFVTSVGKNGGYYLARYEAGVTGDKTLDTTSLTGEKGTAPSTNWTGYTNGKITIKSDQLAWNYITQNKAAEIARNMYPDTNKNITSDLVNSYAWDTAIVYIQRYGTNTNYANQIGESTDDNLANTGMTKLKSTSVIDVQCNIYDMAGNMSEFTTESCSSDNGSCISRGGYYNDNSGSVCSRKNGGEIFAKVRDGFRPILYL